MMTRSGFNNAVDPQAADNPSPEKVNFA